MPPAELSDKDLLKLIDLLDDEGDGNLEIDEIVAFGKSSDETTAATEKENTAAIFSGCALALEGLVFYSLPSAALSRASLPLRSLA
jgi:hypothetical protein